MRKRFHRDCPFPNCGARHLIRLANNRADVHLLDVDQRRKYLQEAKPQPKVKYVVYEAKEDAPSPSKEKNQEQDIELSKRKAGNEKSSPNVTQKSKLSSVSAKWIPF